MTSTVTLDGAAGSGLDWIGAFTNTGQCVGATNLTLFEGTSFMSLTIYGDDPTTPEVVEGLMSGDSFTLRLLDASEALTISYNAGQPFFGWVNTNGGPLPGYANAEAVYAFFTPPCPTRTVTACATRTTRVPIKSRTFWAFAAAIATTTSTATAFVTTRSCLGAPTPPRPTTTLRPPQTTAHANSLALATSTKTAWFNSSICWTSCSPTATLATDQHENKHNTITT